MKRVFQLVEEALVVVAVACFRDSKAFCELLEKLNLLFCQRVRSLHHHLDKLVSFAAAVPPKTPISELPRFLARG